MESIEKIQHSISGEFEIFDTWMEKYEYIIDLGKQLEVFPQQQMIEDNGQNEDPDLMASGGRPGLYANINAKRKRIAAGSGERMRSKGEEGAPTAENFKEAAKTAKMNMGGRPGTRRRKKMMVPASYKTGGQVFQKGY